MKITQFKSRKEWSAAVWYRLIEDIKNPALGALLDSLLSSYEKNMIVNRLAAIALIHEGKTYRQIGQELWLSPTTISSIKRAMINNSAKEYQSQRTIKNKRQGGNRKINVAKEVTERSPFWDRLDFYLENFPKKNGPRWKWVER